VSLCRLARNNARGFRYSDCEPILQQQMSTTQFFNRTSVDYVRGFRDVFRLARMVAYGFSEFVNAVHNVLPYGFSFAQWYRTNRSRKKMDKPYGKEIRILQ